MDWGVGFQELPVSESPGAVQHHLVLAVEKALNDLAAFVPSLGPGWFPS